MTTGLGFSSPGVVANRPFWGEKMMQGGETLIDLDGDGFSSPRQNFMLCRVGERLVWSEKVCAMSFPSLCAMLCSGATPHPLALTFFRGAVVLLRPCLRRGF